MRVGIGYDVHRFKAKRPLILGGIRIPGSHGLAGHSDADVLLHALADALLGAIGAADIGEQFPSSDKRYRAMASRAFVERAVAQIRRKGYAVGNVDATVIADSPRLTGHKQKMAAAMGRLLSVPASAVSVKAKTSEGFCPAKQGIAAQVVVLLKKKKK